MWRSGGGDERVWINSAIVWLVCVLNSIQKNLNLSGEEELRWLESGLTTQI